MDASFFTQKIGPAPVWAYGALGLGAALVVANYRAGKNPPKGAASDTADDTVPQDQVPAYITQNYITVNNEGDDAPTVPGVPTTPTVPPVAPPKTPAPPKPPVVTKPRAKAQEYRVKHGDTLSSIAKRYHTTWQAIWKFNTTAGNRPAATIKTLKNRGPNLLYANELILIPPK